MKCPNCTKNKKGPHRADVCMLAAVATVAQDRGNKSARSISQLLARADADAFWNDIGKIVDRFEAGEYS
jgi:hypothetical protein